MKKRTAAVLAACMLCTSGAFAASAPSAWAQKDVQSAISAQLVPEALQSDWQRPITRAEFCALSEKLMTAQGYTFPKLTGENPFTDTDEESVRRLAAAGVVTGRGDKLFVPGDPISREEAATMLYRLTNTPALPTSYADQRTAYAFADDTEISVWAKEPVSFCYQNKVMTGTGENKFDPLGTYTVEQAAITMLRLQAYAAAQAPTPLTMTAEGIPMLYSNNPENLDPRKFERYGVYTGKTSMPNGTPIDAEYYHWSYLGAEQPLIVGVAVTNNSEKTAQVTIDKRGVGMGTDSITVSEKCYTDFFASEGEEPVSIRPGETKLVLKDTVQGGTMINARAQLTASADGLTMKLVALKQEVSSEFLASLPRAVDDVNGRTAGRFNYSERRAKVDASSVRNFMLCGNRPAHWKINPGEYAQTRELTDPLAIRDTGNANFNFFLNGNFATIYHLDFENAEGKTLTIRPDDHQVKATGGRYMIRTDADGWQTIEASVEKPYEIDLSDGMSMDFLLLGGNFGNIGFRII